MKSSCSTSLLLAACGFMLVPSLAPAQNAKSGGVPAPAAATTNQAAKKSLYDRLGGKRAIAAVIDTFVNLAAADAKVNFTRDGKFKAMDVPFLKGQLTDFVSSATGGPVKYAGRDMKTAHQGMKIKASEFDSLAADLVAALDKYKVPAAEKAELLATVNLGAWMCHTLKASSQILFWQRQVARVSTQVKI